MLYLPGQFIKGMNGLRTQSTIWDVLFDVAYTGCLCLAPTTTTAAGLLTRTSQSGSFVAWGKRYHGNGSIITTEYMA